MAKHTTGWKKQSERHSRAKKYGHAGGRYSSADKKHISSLIREKKSMALTHPRPVAGETGLFYLKAGKIHKTNKKKDVDIKAKHNRPLHSDSWRGDIKGTKY